MARKAKPSKPRTSVLRARKLVMERGKGGANDNGGTPALGTFVDFKEKNFLYPPIVVCELDNCQVKPHPDSNTGNVVVAFKSDSNERRVMAELRADIQPVNPGLVHSFRFSYLAIGYVSDEEKTLRARKKK